MKVTIIGAGRVGTNAAYALQIANIVSEIQLLDVNKELAEGEALDFMHGASVLGEQRFYAGDYDRAADSDIFVITAGARRNPHESRLDLINNNLNLMNRIMDQIIMSGYKDSAVFLIVANPVDILTYSVHETLNIKDGRVLGLGTMLDTTRFRGLIGSEINLPSSQIKALILGEHGDSMVPVWSSSSINGLRLSSFPVVTSELQESIYAHTKQSGAEVISKKGGAGWAVGAVISEVVHSIALDQKKLLPVSSVLNGCYGIYDVSLSVPTIVGSGGAEQHIEVELDDDEYDKLQESGAILKSIICDIEVLKKEFSSSYSGCR